MPFHPLFSIFFSAKTSFYLKSIFSIVIQKHFLTALAVAACFTTAGATETQSENSAELQSATFSETVATAQQDSLVPREYMGRTVDAMPAFPARKPNWWNQIRLTGTLQTEFLIPVDDDGLHQPHNDRDTYAADVLNNTYFDLTMNAPYLSIGARFEWAKWPLPGFRDTRFRNWGVPYIWATGRYKWAALTVGNFYEQFGSGLILRIYEDRTLGIDNALRGGRLKITPAPGLVVTALGGKERFFWEHSSSWLWGADAEWNLSESFHKAFGKDYGLTLGVSYVGKHEKDVEKLTPDFTHRYNFPRNTAAFDARIRLKLHDFSVLLEGATKNNDPSIDNNYTYRRGTAALASVTYSASGFSALVQAKRSDNMHWRTERSIEGIYGFVNYLPPFTMTQTYALAAMYPYATQVDGEWAYQFETRWLARRGTPLGGKYGTNFRLSGSLIMALDRNWPDGVPHIKESYIPGSDGYGTPFWKAGSLNYADINVEINKKLSRSFSLTLFYMFQKFNQKVVWGHAENGDMVNSHIAVVEGQWKIKRNTQLRFEAQYLHTKQDMGDWLAATIELSLAPHWMFTITDMQNFTGDNIVDPEYKKNKNYYSFGVTYSYLRNRFYVAYGRTREGYNCSGGICRWVPASKGFTITYNYTF